MNNTSGKGGGIYCEESEAKILDNIIEKNYAISSGGGIYCKGNLPITIKGNRITNNQADADGGGIYSSCLIYICTNTIARNRARGPPSSDTGGVVGVEGTYLLNNIIWNNTSLYTTAPTDLSGVPHPNIWFNDISDANYAGFNGNISQNPLLADPNNGDYRLKSQAGRWDPNSSSWTIDDVTSPCIAAGNPGEEPNNPANIRIEMGAYGGTAEASKTPEGKGLLSDLTNDNIVNLVDYAAMLGWRIPTDADDPNDMTGQPGDINRDGEYDFRDLGNMADEWLIAR